MNPIFTTPLYPYQRSRDQDHRSPQRHPVIIAGAGPTGLSAAIDLASADIPVVVLDNNDKVSHGSRAICFAKRTLEILDRLGCGERCVAKGVVWNKGKVFLRDKQIYSFDLLPEPDHKRPAFINLQQYYLELFLVEHLRSLQQKGKPVEIRGRNAIIGVDNHPDRVQLKVQTPEGDYSLEADWLLACDGANSFIRQHLGHSFIGTSFNDNFLIADVSMTADFPTERWFWFDPPFNRDQSALLHKQPDNVWRIDLQLGANIDKEQEQRPERVLPRLRAMLGADTQFELEWVSIYSFRCSRMQRFRHGRMSSFSATPRIKSRPLAPAAPTAASKTSTTSAGNSSSSYKNSPPPPSSTATTTNAYKPQKKTSATPPAPPTSSPPNQPPAAHLRDAVLALAEHHAFARPLVNSGRLSTATTYQQSPLSSTDSDHQHLPACSRPGAVAPDAALGR